jgi:hypothetical protein
LLQERERQSRAKLDSKETAKAVHKKLDKSTMAYERTQNDGKKDISKAKIKLH